MNSYFSPYSIIGGISAVSFIILLVWYVLLVIGKWKVFEKAGIEGWKSLIPFYSNYLLYQIAIGQGLLFLITLVPVVGILMNIYMYWQLCRDFGKDTLFTVLTVLFPGICMIILGFGNDTYTWPDNFFTRNLEDPD